MTVIDFIYFDAGGGHRAAATALKNVIENQRRPWDVRLVNLQEVLDPLDVFRKVTGIRLEDVYNRMLAKGWTLGSEYGVVFMHGVMRMYHNACVNLLREHWRSTRPDMVVSIVPNLDRAMRDGLMKEFRSVPYVTVLTDFADYPPHFWMEKPLQGTPEFVVCGTEKAVEQARAIGFHEDRIRATSGMIVRPRFYEPVEVDRRAERLRLGLNPDKPVALVLFGGQGSNVMADIAERVPDTQMILICGKNDKLAARLRAQTSKSPRFVEGFTSEIPYYMKLADYMIGKPGPGSISEAVLMGLPVIVECNAWTLVQERFNTEWVKEKGVGIVLRNFSEIREGVARMERELSQFQANVGRVHNRAVFEIPDMLEQILTEVAPAQAAK